MEIRFVQPDEVEQLKRNVLTAFPSKTPEALLNAMHNELYHPEEGRYLGCFDDRGALIGSALLMDFQLNVRGKMMFMGAPAYVSCSFLRKKEHIARDLLRVYIGYYAKLGAAVGCLHPFSPSFYNKMGFGFGNESYMFSPKPSGVRNFGYKGDIRYAEEGDQEEILSLYRRYVSRTHGGTIHPFMDYHRIFDMPYVVVCEKNGRITGYLTYEFVEVDHYTDMYHDLAVREMIWDDADTLKQFMTFFASQTDQIERVRIYTPDESLHVMFQNQDSGENKAFDGAIQEIGRRNMGYMCRILDIKQYFALQNFCQKPAARPFTMCLRVSDSFVPSNQGDWYFKVEGEKVSQTDACSADVTLAADIAELSSFVMGAVSLSCLAQYDRVTISDLSYLDDIQNAIGWDQKPKNLTYF